MTISLTYSFNRLKDSLRELDACFSPQIQELCIQKKLLADKHQQKYLQRDSLLKKANVQLDDRLVNVQGHLASVKAKIHQEGIQLNTTIASIEQKISSIKKTIDSKSSTLKKLSELLKHLKEEKKSLQRDIDERGIIESIWKYLFGDPENKALSDVKQNIQKQYTEQKQIQADYDVLCRELGASQKELARHESSLKNAREQLVLQNQRIADIRAAMQQEDEAEQLLLQIKALELNIHNLEKKAKETRALCLSQLNAICQEVRTVQPQLDNYGLNSLGNSKTYPEMFAFGRLRFSDASETWRGYLPRLLPFPLKSSLRFGVSGTSKDWLNAFLLRAFQTLPCNHLSVTVIDPLQLGMSLPAYQLLLKNKRPFSEQRFLTRSDEIEGVLNSQLLYVENLIQQVFVGGINNWQEYNKANTDNPLDYRLLIVFDIPEQLTEKSNLYLSRLLEHGPRCGVLPLIVCDYSKFDEHRNKALLDSIKKFTWDNEEIYSKSSMTSSLKYLKFSEELEQFSASSQFEKIIERLSQLFAQLSGFSGTMQNLWAQTPMWSGHSGDGLFANIGWTVAGNKPVVFSIGGVTTEHHTLLGGKSGSGKSNLLHILIHSLCHTYSPDELNLYLLDYKQGTEFNIYADPYLPHAKLVATESDVDYGITVLKFLTDELERRSTLFKSAGAITDYREYRRQISATLPRILLVIDEFQMLFAGDMHAGLEAEKALVELLRQGRAYGIHLLLSTQTLKGLQNQSIGQLISQMGCRIALSCSEEDSSMLLGNSNWEAAKLQSPPEGILNNENGNKSANIRFNIPFAPKDARLQHQETMLAKATQAKMQYSRKVFNGNMLPAVPTPETFQIDGMPGDIPLLLGENLDFESALFIANLKKENLLLAGYDTVLRNGLATSLMHSICALPKEKSVIIYQAHEDEVGIYGKFAELPFLIQKDASWDGLDLTEFEQSSVEEKFLIIDSLDFGRIFHPAPIGTLRKPGQASNPNETLRKIMDATASNHIHVILFVENYRRFANSAKDLLNLFDLRIGFGLDEDDAGNFVASGGYGKFKGLRQTNKAVFINRKLNQVAFIRPFAGEKEK